ncbi:polysaccharide deacetylase family protein [Nocardiopsis potens]|uniref:polysaccharide deacetylase family protein n=1 Tax=Nocardiopsis potens TaxID=1246458 RepID=UPI00068737CC|nr:polysaccharide deacetylase family protein [Nocardiopsis potens]
MSPTLEIPFRFRRPDLTRLRVPDPLRRASPRHALAGLTALALLAVPAAAAVRTAPAAAPAEALPDSVAGAETVEYRVEQDGVAVSASYPEVPGAPAFGGEVRTAMAEAQSEFLAEHGSGGGPASLEQRSEFLAASGNVLGARIVRETSVDGDTRVETTTRWFDGSAGQALPWTALFGGADQVAALDAAVARALREEAGLAPEEMPAGLASDGGAEPPAGPGGGEAPRVDAAAARALAEEYAGSPLQDVAFDSAGGLVVTVARGASGELHVPVAGDRAAPLLSEFGARARDAVAAGAPLDLEDAGGAPGASLDCDRVPCVALTFDDGPGEHTARLLDELDAYSAKATFYLLGQLVAEDPGVVRRIRDEGHELGNHSWKHDDLAGKSGGAVADDLERTAEAIEEAAGAPPLTVRPPYGSFNGTTLENAGAPVLLWDVDTLDWQSRDSGKVADTAVEDARPGSVVLMHDIHASTVDAVPEILRRLHAEGFHFVTVQELFAGTGLEDGTAYHSRPDPADQG